MDCYANDNASILLSNSVVEHRDSDVAAHNSARVKQNEALEAANAMLTCKLAILSTVEGASVGPTGGTSVGGAGSAGGPHERRRQRRSAHSTKSKRPYQFN